MQTDVHTKATVLALPTSSAPPSCNIHEKKVVANNGEYESFDKSICNMERDKVFELHQ
jgi:hypothetical protein